MRKIFLLAAAALFFGFMAASCSVKTAEKTVKSLKQAPTTHKDQYLLLVSLDGFRWDYVERFQPPNLLRFIAGGVGAEAMLSSFPSKTFPNHYTIATGMYPDHHGLVDNNFLDREKNAVYGIGRREIVEDGSWYGGTPIWVHAAQSGLKTASFFFVGSEADIKGIRPTYFYKYDGSIANERRVEQVLEWLQLPESERPRCIALYFSDMDDVGHRYGPNADEPLREKLLALDAVLGKLFEGAERSGLPVNIIVVSDHGMSPVPVANLLPIEPLEDETRYRTVNSGALAHFYLNPGVDEQEVYSHLKSKENRLKVYRTAETPYFETPPSNPRWGEFIAIPDPGHYLVNARTMAQRKSSGIAEIGEHGFDPENKEMYGIFYAKGPALKKGMTIPPFKNIHVYPLMCRILGLEIPKDIDGREEVLKGTLLGD